MDLNGSRGFTLFELMITLALLIILLGVAIPSYRVFIANQQVRTVSSNLLSALSLARSEAVKRAAVVTLAPASGSGVGAWNNGWLVSVGGVELRRYPAAAGATIVGPGASLTYGRDGRTSGGAAAFTVSPEVSSGATPRYVCVSLGGKPKTQRGACS